MARVLIKCPTTGEMVPTGTEMDRESFESAKMEQNSVQCTACGEMHSWDKEDAVLED